MLFNYYNVIYFIVISTMYWNAAVSIFIYLNETWIWYGKLWINNILRYKLCIFSSALIIFCSTNYAYFLCSVLIIFCSTNYAYFLIHLANFMASSYVSMICMNEQLHTMLKSNTSSKHSLKTAGHEKSEKFRWGITLKQIQN